MAEITITAADSASAMEEIALKLGPDAYILSTKRDGNKVVMVATDNTSNYQSSDIKPFVLKPENRVVEFSSILKKYTDAPDKIYLEKHQKGNIQSKVESVHDEILQDLHKNIDKLAVLISNKKETAPFTAEEKLRLVGLSNHALQKIKLGDNKNNLEDLAAQLSNTFVANASSLIYDTQLLIVAGRRGVGKTRFIEKFKLWLNSAGENLSVTEFSALDAAVSSVTSINWGDQGYIPRRNGLAIVEVEYFDGLDSYLEMLAKTFPDIRYKILNVERVGLSRNYVLKNCRKPVSDQEYLVLTKLDQCDLSLDEISAYLELGLRCCFFTGNIQDCIGIYPAKVAHLKQHILEVAKTESTH